MHGANNILLLTGWRRDSQDELIFTLKAKITKHPSLRLWSINDPSHPEVGTMSNGNVESVNASYLNMLF